MKVLCISDLHGNLTGLEDFITDEIEVIAFAGDIAKLNGRGKWHIYDQKKWVEKKLFALCNNYVEKQFIFIPGNHDFFPIAQVRYSDLNFKLSFPQNCHMLIDQLFTYKDKTFYGTPHVPIISHTWAFEAESDKQKQFFSKIPENLDLLISHSPPHIGSDKWIDRSVQYGYSEPFGSNALAEAILAKKPKHVICGHIHSGNHECHNFFGTEIYNVSRVNEDYEIAYDPLILDI